MRGQKFKIRSEKPFFCREIRSALLKTDNGIISEAKFTKIPCNSWTCPDCCFRKALKVKYMLRDIIDLNDLNRFLTLTLDPKKVPAEYLSTSHNDTHKYITKLFNHFLVTLKRKKFTYFDKKKNKYFTFDLKSSKEKLKYVWVVEFQKNGNAHLHILFNIFLPIYVLQKIWLHVGGGHSMNIQKVETPKGISNYLSDYIVKGIKGDLEEKPYGFKYFERRLSISMSCIRPVKPYPIIKMNLSLSNLIMVLNEQKLEWILYNLLKIEEEDKIIKFTDDRKNI